ncbi:hypothetical protein EJ02DRAFT_449972 [Clathrospora elynae]|uniref:Uncharacterized protein n=1 Tax=Clathrospora elynae TaxID=706981 RepID=A0A6A5T323_9PLEO|nr:hypothetical protein EJ02DRAFT_449972 [Clathrospora elynae]
MDCGEDDGHKWDCHIGNVKRMENLSVLDYNILADAVQRFDPGPWTTHFNQFPEPESEDGETQVQEMAGVIRNEDSYKDDAELHILPNEAMIMLWAFKTADGVVVINE